MQRQDGRAASLFFLSAGDNFSPVHPRISSFFAAVHFLPRARRKGQMQAAGSNGGDGKRRKTPSVDVVVPAIFMAIPSDIMHELCLYIRMWDLFYFLGQTSRAIRQAYYKPSSFFTEERPLHLPVTPDSLHTTMTPWLFALLQRALPGDRPLPAHLHHFVYPTMCAWHEYPREMAYPKRVPLSLFAYTARGCSLHIPPLSWDDYDFVLCEVSQTTRVLCIAGNWSDLCRSASALSVAYPNVEVLDVVHCSTIDSIRLLDFAQCFPCIKKVRVHESCAVGRPSICDEMKKEPSLFDLLDISIMSFVDLPVSTEEVACDRRCMQRTTGKFVIYRGMHPAALDVLKADLERRRTAQQTWRVEISSSRLNPFPPGPPVRALGQYVTDIVWDRRSDHQCVLAPWTALTSVRRITVQRNRPTMSDPVITITGPDDVLLLGGDDDYADIVIESARPLRHADVAYLDVALTWIASPDTRDALLLGDMVALDAKLKAIRHTFPLDYDYAFRVRVKLVLRVDDQIHHPVFAVEYV